MTYGWNVLYYKQKKEAPTPKKERKMKTETKTITQTLRITIDQRYNEVVVLDNHNCEVEIIGWDWTEAGYEWEKDIAPIIALVLADKQDRTVTMSRVKNIETFGTLEDHEKRAAIVENGYGDADF